jgi:hypothetical protein
MTVAQKEKYQHQDRIFMDNGQSNVCEAWDFLAFASFLSQTNYLFSC